MKIKRVILSLTAVFILCQITVLAQQPQPNELADYIKANYTKREVQIPMRDGIKLFTSIYEPKDKSQKYPFMFDRTPYTVAPYGPDKFKGSLGPNELFAKEGKILIHERRGERIGAGIQQLPFQIGLPVGQRRLAELAIHFLQEPGLADVQISARDACLVVVRLPIECRSQLFKIGERGFMVGGCRIA